MPALEQIRQRAAENGVPDLDWLTPAQVKAMERALVWAQAVAQQAVH